MTREQLLAKYPHASESFLRANSAGGAGVRADDPQPTQGNTLVGAPPRKSKGRKGAVLGAARRHIRFTIYAVRPSDWDGLSVKELQDCLRHAGLLDADDWNLLYGTVISEKVDTKEQERTEIEIT